LITTEDDPTPFVLLMANTVRRSAAAAPDVAARLKGVAAVRSAGDPQAVTLRFDRGTVHLEHGVASDVDVIVTVDLATEGLPDAPAPQVKGALRHPRLALGLAKVLDPPLPDLPDALEEFWAAVGDLEGMPAGLRVIATDDGSSHQVGCADGDVYEMLGPADRLVGILTGTAFVLEEVQSGRCHGRGTLAAAAAITRAGILFGIDDQTQTSNGPDHA